MRSGQKVGESDHADLAAALNALEGAPYPAYRSIRGSHAIGNRLILEVLSVQPDPFAPPTRLCLRVPLVETGLSVDDLSSDSARTAAEDFLARAIEAWLRSEPPIGAVVKIDPSVQQILKRTAVCLGDREVQVRLFAALPARGRRIEGRRAATALAGGLPRLVRETMLRGAWDAAALARHRATVEDHRALTGILAQRDWVAFLADGSRLARRSGEEDTPLDDGNVPFVAPSEMAAEIELPHAGRLRGLAIPSGITLLCGGGFHGKSTLLRALAAGVYPHIPGDGRERIASEPTATSIRAEDGRAITRVDLRPFITRLPDDRDVASFETTKASGSTSQAAAIIEAIEIGSRCLLIDEDTSATNFLLRDPWMARLLRPEQEPIVPLFSRLREIRERFGLSTVLVVGGSGEAFRVADRVIVMDRYRPHDGTARAAALRDEMGPGLSVPAAEWPDPGRDLPLGALRARRPRVRALTARRLLVGTTEIDLSASGALVHPSQGRTLAAILNRWIDEGSDTVRLPDFALDAALEIGRCGPGAFWTGPPRGDMCEVRASEISMMMNRLRVRAGGRAGRSPGETADAGSV